MERTGSAESFERVRSFLLHVERDRPHAIATKDFLSFIEDLGRAFPNWERDATRANSDSLVLFYFGGFVGCLGMLLFNLLLR
jgi:hypothetical protein